MTKDSTRQQEINRRRQIVSKLRHEGVKTQEDITTRLREDYGIDVTRQTVSNDLKALDQIWRASAIENTDKVKQELLKQYRYIYQQALIAWERSTEDTEAIIQEAIDDGSVTKLDKNGNPLPKRLKVLTRSEGQSGNPALLAQAQAALKAIREMFGVDAAAKVEQSGSVALKIEYVNDWRSFENPTKD